MAQKFERLVQEDLNVGTSPTWVCCPGRGELKSTQLGIHSFSRQGRSYSATWAPGSIAAGGEVDTTITVPGARTRDFVLASHDKILTNDLQITAHVSAADTIIVIIHNPGTAAVTVSSGTLRVLDFINCDLLVSVGASETTPSVGEDVTFTPTPSGGVSPYTYRWDFGDSLPRIPRSGLVAYWSMDEASGTRTNTLGDGGTDCDLNETSGTIASEAGKYSNCAVFNPDDTAYFETTGVPAFGRGYGTGYTIAGWVWRSNAAATASTIIARDKSSSIEFLLVDQTWYVWNDAGTGTFLALWDYNDPLDSGGPAEFNSGQWDFFVGWADFTNLVMGAQINGGTAKIKPISGTFATPSTSPIRFGVRVYNLSNYFEGKVDAWVAYDRVLTDDERLILYDGMSRLENPVYQYQTAETVTATGIATDAAGCTASDTVEITIGEGPTAEFTSLGIEGGLVGEGMVEFTDATSGGTPPYVTYAWDFGDGSGTSSDASPTYTFNQNGGANPQTFTVTLTVTDDAGGVDSVQHDVEVTFTL